MLTKCLLAAVLVFQACLAVPTGLQPRITDGQTATPGEFPYQVSIEWGIPPLIPYRHVCGGSIIHQQFVLTAGHCILKRGSFRVVGGKHYMNQQEGTEQVIAVKKAIVHKDYNGGVAQHDIALMRLAAPFYLNERVALVQLPKQDELQVGSAVLTGWGSISKKIRPVLPTVLQKAVVPILDNAQCLQELVAVKPIGKQPEIFNTQVCSGAAGTQISACSGDSGGPLTQFNGKTPVQVGVVSWGFYPCGKASTPSVYTRVASYIDWIHEIMGLYGSL